jgi:hypothetical protein
MQAFRNFLKQDPFPPRMFSQLQYTHTGSLATGAAANCGSEQVFRLNSLYDPDFTGAGHQPYGFDQISPLYRQYKVTSVDIDIQLTDPSTDGILVAALVQPPAGTFSLTGKQGYAVSEKPGAEVRMLNDSGSQTARIKQHFEMSDLCQISKLEFDANQSNYVSAVTTNPALSPWLRIAIANMNGGSSSGATVFMNVTLTFHVVFYERVTQLES